MDGRTVQLALSALAVECRVVRALMLREIHSLYGDARLGYLWALIQTSISIIIFWAMRKLMGTPSPHGMSVAMFLISGFFVWNVISFVILKSLTAVEANASLLYFPQVTELDVFVARAGVVYVTEVVVCSIMVGAAFMLGEDVRVHSWGTVFAVLIFLPLLALGLGLTLDACAVLCPVLSRLVPFVIRGLFFISGVFFSATFFARDIAELLLYNPVFQLIELLRHGIYLSYPAYHCSWLYLSVVTVCLLALGAVMERYVRTRRLDK